MSPHEYKFHTIPIPTYSRTSPLSLSCMWDVIRIVTPLLRLYLAWTALQQIFAAGACLNRSTVCVCDACTAVRSVQCRVSTLRVAVAQHRLRTPQVTVPEGCGAQGTARWDETTPLRRNCLENSVLLLAGDSHQSGIIMKGDYSTKMGIYYNSSDLGW
jgi:hypothetical protein